MNRGGWQQLCLSYAADKASAAEARVQELERQYVRLLLDIEDAKRRATFLRDEHRRLSEER